MLTHLDHAGLLESTIREEAQKSIAGGVVSLNRKVSPDIIFKEAKGSKLYDHRGKAYIDYHAAFAPYLLGHNDPDVNAAAAEAMQKNWSLFGSNTTLWEAKLAVALQRNIPSLELLQIANTGSESTAHAIRLSRAWTGREDIILTLGGYNGWHNEVARAVMPSLEQTGPRISPGEYPFIPMSAGIPEATKSKVHIVNFNDLDSIEYVMKKYPVACVLTEPVLQNIGIVLPKPGYLEGIVQLCGQHGAVCIFDEVKTGFRTCLGGYQKISNVTPHLSVFGKAISNGFPLGVVGGKKEIMELFDHPDPSKRVLIAGTYNAHPVNVAAALATISKLQTPGVYEHINEISKRLYAGLTELLESKGIPHVLSANASAFVVYFMEKAPCDLHDIMLNHNFDFDLRFRRALIEHGVYHIPIACKQGSVSFAHSEEDIDLTLEQTKKVLNKI